MSNRIEEIEVYNLSEDFAVQIWNTVITWDYFAKDTIGKQLVRSSDSISANIAEDFGRYHFKENKNFCYYSRGSAKETLTAIRKAKSRNLISEEEFKLLDEKLELYFRLIYGYINSIGTTNSTDD